MSGEKTHTKNKRRKRKNMVTTNKGKELQNVVNKTVQLLDDTTAVLLSTPAVDEQAVIIQDKLWAIRTLKDYIKGLTTPATDSPIPANIFLFGNYTPEELKLYKLILGDAGLDLKRWHCCSECSDCEISNLCTNVHSAYNVVATYTDAKKKEVNPV